MFSGYYCCEQFSGYYVNLNQKSVPGDMELPVLLRTLFHDIGNILPYIMKLCAG